MKTLRRALVLLAALAVLLPAGAGAAQHSGGGPPSPSTAPQPLPGEAWAVLIGINRYQNPRVPKLRYAVNDAQAVERALLAQGFRQDRIFTLTDDKATKAGIEQLLGDELRQQLGAHDRAARLLRRPRQDRSAALRRGRRAPFSVSIPMFLLRKRRAFFCRSVR